MCDKKERIKKEAESSKDDRLAYLVRQGSISARGKANYNLINGNPDGVPYKCSIGSAETAEPMFISLIYLLFRSARRGTASIHHANHIPFSVVLLDTEHTVIRYKGDISVHRIYYMVSVSIR